MVCFDETFRFLDLAPRQRDERVQETLEQTTVKWRTHCSLLRWLERRQVMEQMEMEPPAEVQESGTGWGLVDPQIAVAWPSAM